MATKKKAANKKAVAPTADSFASTDWLRAMGDPIAAKGGAKRLGTMRELDVMLEEDPDGFFAPPYTSPTKIGASRTTRQQRKRRNTST